MARLAEEASLAQPLSPQMMILMARLLNPGGPHEIARQREIAWLRKAQVRHPADFWLNFELGYLLIDKNPADAESATSAPPSAFVRKAAQPASTCFTR